MTDDDLVGHIELLEAQAGDNMANSVAAEQAKAMQYYLGKPFGTEEEGRSSVISSDTWDVVEGLTPLVLKPFVSSDEIVRFNAQGPEDEQAAEQESDYINFIVTQKNNVFTTLIDWVKMGLLQKNGVVKYWWETSQRKKIERYDGLTDDVYAALLQDDGIEVIEHTEREVMGEIDPQTGMPMPALEHDVVLRISEEHGEPRYCVIPPEEFRISHSATNVDPKMARFVAHVTRKTISELREMGYDVEDDVADDGTEDPRMSDQYSARRDGNDPALFMDGADPSTREVLFREVYLLVDFDGDGMAELRRVCMVGKTILANDETEEIPFVSWTPYPQPFQYHGRCPADETLELQIIKSTVLRQTMDNIYTINNNRQFVSNKVNMDDLLDNAIAGIVRVEGDIVGNHVMSAPITPIGAVTMPMIEYFDQAKENRTGFTKYNQGTDSNSLNKTATGIRIISEAGNERVGLVSRCFAEQGLKPLMLGIHGLCRRHGTKKEVIRMRGKYVEVDPRSWVSRYDMSVSVGLGSADRQMQMQGAQLLIETQMRMGEAGLGTVSPQNLYEAGVKLAQSLGEKNPDKYFTAPPQEPPPPPDPTKDPQFMVEMEKIGIEKEKVAAQKQKDDGDLAIRAQELQIKQGALSIQDRDSKVAAGAKAAEFEMREGEFGQQNDLARQQFEHSKQAPEDEAAREDAQQSQTLEAIKSLAEAMQGAQKVMQKMLEKAQAPRPPLRVRKDPDGSYVGVHEEDKK